MWEVRYLTAELNHSSWEINDKKIPNSRPCSKQREQNLALCESPKRFNLYPTSEKNGSKTIPFSIHKHYSLYKGKPPPILSAQQKATALAIQLCQKALNLQQAGDFKFWVKQYNSLCTDVPSPSGKIGRRDLLSRFFLREGGCLYTG